MPPTKGTRGRRSAAKPAVEPSMVDSDTESSFERTERDLIPTNNDDDDETGASETAEEESANTRSFRATSLSRKRHSTGSGALTESPKRQKTSSAQARNAATTEVDSDGEQYPVVYSVGRPGRSSGSVSSSPRKESTTRLGGLLGTLHIRSPVKPEQKPSAAKLKSETAVVSIPAENQVSLSPPPNHQALEQSTAKLHFATAEISEFTALVIQRQKELEQALFDERTSSLQLQRDVEELRSIRKRDTIEKLRLEEQLVAAEEKSRELEAQIRAERERNKSFSSWRRSVQDLVNNS